MSADIAMSDELPACGLCKAPICGHHKPECIRWGPVVPSECPGLIEKAIAEVLLKREKERGNGPGRDERSPG